MDEMSQLEARRRGLSNPLARRIAMVGKETYNKQMGKQQGTTRTIYDTIPLTGSPNVFNFFENFANKGFPWTNLNRNSFTDQEAMNIQRAYLSIIQTSDNTDYAILAATTIQIYSIYQKAGENIDPVTKNQIAKFSMAQASIFVSGQQILKNFTFLSADPRFNYKNQGFSQTSASLASTGATGYGTRSGIEVYEFASPAVIPPNREFIVSVQVPPYDATVIDSTGTNTYLRLTLEGFGAIPSVEGTL
jgi:hypothetical protein